MSSASRNISTIMRVALGILFLAHGIAKFQMGLGNVAGWFASIGVPGFLGYVVAVIELVGGIALILGLLTRYVSGLLVIVLIGAIFTAKLSGGLMGNGQGAGYELDIAFILVALHLVFAPTTRLSLDSLFGRRESTEK
ncbi:DoxX family protein [Paenibacillus sp. SEL1]|uniref:DoxX family protein n=1 Tax=Paenibacillus TaxID=44249 RepID=UPI00077CADAC|nr:MULTISPECIES: DoxX family protein [Paenibacillus]KYG97005.1 oxidoreductase [Paenibacillus polymyxa]MCP3778640.1 DoxX family protein [Paenibacillus sp. MZ03-122A]MCP3806250.1 DoxX family protein [Paenibacillus sp. Lou8.1]MDY8047362.1 DoxX family protein [Paenibacillus polymyxa]URJ41997.1 DoxX family protein [Paenibacillus polymyxa]